MYITYSCLADKDVINCNDGSNLGNIIDLEISSDDCRIVAIIVKQTGKLLCKSDTIKIPWEKIEKIGSDVIIVNCACLKNDNSCPNNEPKKSLFKR